MNFLKHSLATFLIALSITAANAQDRNNPAIGGYCPICYFSDKATKGSPDNKATHKGKTYYFVNKEAAEAFKKNPDKYAPQYDGWCAYGVTWNQKVEIDPTVFSVVDGKLYLNKNKNKKIGERFDKKPRKYIEKADKKWVKLKDK